MRQNQLLHIRMMDVDLEGNCIELRLEGSKTYREWKVPIVSHLRPSLEILIEQARNNGAGPSDHLFHVSRFLCTHAGWQRHLMVSALTIFGLDEIMARYASYEDLTDIIRQRFDAPKETLQELFGRLVFNIISGNTDDHARNHAAFWDGNKLSLTPAYDICPQGRSGNEATQAMLIIGENRKSNLAVCLSAAAKFLLSEQEAIEIITRNIRTVHENWAEVCREASLSEVDRNFLWGRVFLNPFIFEDSPEMIAHLR
jgi:serine/threonine-protein kinase HipA